MVEFKDVRLMGPIHFLALIIIQYLLFQGAVAAQDAPARFNTAQVLALSAQLSIDTAKIAEVARIYGDFRTPIAEVLAEPSLSTAQRQERLRPLLRARQEQLRQLLTEAEYMRLWEHYRPIVADFHAKRESERESKRQVRGVRVNGSKVGDN